MIAKKKVPPLRRSFFLEKLKFDLSGKRLRKILVRGRDLCYNSWEMYYTYFVRCADGSLYAGYTNDLNRRVEAHNAGKGAKYTRSRLPVLLVYSESFDEAREARSREWNLKRLTRAQKEALIAQKDGAL